ncbi:NAD(P)-dependent dehydrogenase (short-subunit alcohol dehydrogenase family) [Granulicella aggregans]|uniref:NAD(P)-dependent dehydrogenase (Short-subunit alcohol dehydrogenase family) n=1 Tax=Granulicella aggregans TaxID=474949 RepID=A0A7W8E5Y1_9BACT|nr:glucose 1-dehydrogenase [Granulicella aggregans]MBB5060107.1 NAD(P)-dependent dehydrogenase (short-subunit alcohol dehydrogenase family) [Granulicella aggregans]
MGKLDGKVALITGGTSGIGFATARLFVAEGAQIYVTGRRKDKVEEAVTKIGKGCIGVQGNVADMADLDRLFNQITKEFGRLDIVFANAGTAEYAPMGQIDGAHFERIFNANVKGLLFSVQKALPLMREGSTVVLTSSVVGSKGFSSNSVYAASKAAIRSFARTWTTDLKDRKIRVNVVSPGSIDTEGFRELVGTSPVGQQRMTNLAKAVPVGRTGHPDEIAKAVLFLASDDSSYITGTEIFVDGGLGQV